MKARGNRHTHRQTKAIWKCLSSLQAKFTLETPTKSIMAVHSYDSSTWEVEERGSGVQNHKNNKTKYHHHCHHQQKKTPKRLVIKMNLETLFLELDVLSFYCQLDTNQAWIRSFSWEEGALNEGEFRSDWTVCSSWGNVLMVDRGGPSPCGQCHN